MPDHKLISAAEVHTVYRKVFADEAARIADAGPYKTVELNIKAIQVDTAIEYRLTVIAPVTWTAVGGGSSLSAFWPIQQQVSQDYAFVQGGDQAISVSGINISEGVLPGKCMCQLTARLMGDASGGAATAAELYLITVSLAADSGGDEPWERLLGTDDVGLVREVDSGNLSHASISLTGLTLDALSQLEFTAVDTNLGDGDWTLTVLITRSEFIPTP